MSEDSYVRRVDMAVELAKMDAALRRDYIVRRQNQIIEEKCRFDEGVLEKELLFVLDICIRHFTHNKKHQ